MATKKKPEQDVMLKADGSNNAKTPPKPPAVKAKLPEAATRSRADNQDIRDDIGDAMVAICQTHNLGRMDFARFNANVQQVLRSAWGPSGWWARAFPGTEMPPKGPPPTPEPMAAQTKAKLKREGRGDEVQPEPVSVPSVSAEQAEIDAILGASD